MMELVKVHPLLCNTILFQAAENLLHGLCIVILPLNMPPAEVEFDDLASHMNHFHLIRMLIL